MILRQIVAIRLPAVGPRHHSAIIAYRYKNQQGLLYDINRMDMVNWMLQDKEEHKAYVKDRKGDVAYCKVMHNQYGTYYLETKADGIYADNLLALPQF